jgi:hypothetical protein
MSCTRPCPSRTWFGIALLLASACAAVPASPPATAERDPDPNYPGRCSFVRLEAIDRPSSGRGTGPDNSGSGTLELVATYRPGDNTPEPEVAYSFRVAQERVDDLRAHLQQHPDIVCAGESRNSDQGATASESPTFEGQQGRRITKPTASDGQSTPP